MVVPADSLTDCRPEFARNTLRSPLCGVGVCLDWSDVFSDADTNRVLYLTGCFLGPRGEVRGFR